MFVNYRITDFFEEKQSKREKCIQNEKSGNYQHFIKVDILYSYDLNISPYE